MTAPVFSLPIVGTAPNQLTTAQHLEVAVNSALTELYEDGEQTELAIRSDAGNPAAGPSDDWAALDLDQTGRPVRGIDRHGRDYRAYSGCFVREVTPDLSMPDIFGRREIVVDADHRIVRMIDVSGIIHEARRGRLLPIGNTGELRCAVAYGDSTTYGDELASRDSERWTTLLGAALGIAITNRGVNGQTTGSILMRMGARVPRGTVTGGVIPSTGSVSITGITDDISSGPVTIITDAGRRIYGRFTRASATSGSFARYDAGAGVVSAVTVDLYADQGWRDLAAHAFIGMGINDEPGIVSGSVAVGEIKARYRQATSSCRGGFTVWGILDRGISEAAGTQIGDYIREMESWLSVEYGRNWCPVRQYLSSQRALSDAARVEPSFTPTSADNEAVTAGVIPPSFRFSGVHLNARGHKLQAICLERHLRNQFNL